MKFTRFPRIRSGSFPAFALCWLVIFPCCSQTRKFQPSVSDIPEHQRRITKDQLAAAYQGQLSFPAYTLAQYAAEVKAAMGTFPAVPVFQENADKTWTLLNGQYVPITVDDQTPTTYTAGMKSDSPIMLPLHSNNDGQSVPYSVVGRIAGSNPEVQWVFVVRKYKIRPNPDKVPGPGVNNGDFDTSPDVAIIGHHPRTGATAFFQYYGPGSPKSAKTIPDPWSNPSVAAAFWDSPSRTASNGCASCHNADPFIHSPWIQQVLLPSNDAAVPSNPLGPYFYLASGSGQPFSSWNTTWPVKHLKDATNQCVQCHRISPYDGATLNRNSTRAWLDPNQTDMYQTLHWMPPVYPLSNQFYAGQAQANQYWTEFFQASADTVNSLMPSSPNLADISNPPAAFQNILVSRPNQDSIPASSSLWMVDTRMRANRDTQLAKWKFIAKGTDATVTAAPVVYRILGENDRFFTVIHVGQAQTLAASGTWVNFNGDSSSTAVNQGDYFGLLLSNPGSGIGQGLIPYTEDTWAEQNFPGGGVRYRMGYVNLYTGPVPLVQPPVGSSQVNFSQVGFRTYSFEFQSAP